MKSIIAAVVLAMSMSAFAGGYDRGGDGVEAEANSRNFNAAGSASVNEGNDQSVNFNSPDKVKYEGGYTIKSAPPVSAPGLTTTLSETCMGSSSLGVSVIGFGISGGTTWVDSRCARRLDGRDLRAMGFRTTACELMKMTPEIATAFERSGETCTVAVTAVPTPAAVAPAATPEMVNPVTE